MDNSDTRKAEGSVHTYDMFQLLCEGADLVSGVWQPLLKSVGRWNLEVAGLGVRQTQATLQLSRDFARCRTPGDVASANLRYWEAMTSQFSESSQRLAATAARSVAEPAITNQAEAVTLRFKAHDRDLIIIPDDTTTSGSNLRVA